MMDTYGHIQTSTDPITMLSLSGILPVYHAGDHHNKEGRNRCVVQMVRLCES